jgi:hypothetical protein
MGFQTSVNINPAYAVAGDFASANPRTAVVAGAGGFVAASGGVTTGLFGWTDSTNTLVSNAGTGVPRGFIANEMQASITTWLAQAGTTVQAGEPVTLYSEGDFWAVTSTAATVGQKIFASNTTGQIQTAAAGATVSGYTETKWYAGNNCNAGELVKMTSWN